MPASPEEAYSMTRLAFALSEHTGAPVFVLGTTAVANAITAMRVGDISREVAPRTAFFPRNLAKFTKAAPQWCRDQHTGALQRLEQAGEYCRNMPQSLADAPVFTVPAETQGSPRSRLGIIAAGVSFSYLQELRARAPRWFADVPVLKLGLVNPLPLTEIRAFLAGLDHVLILEELDPLIETQVLAVIGESGLPVRVYGKRDGLLSRVGDYSLEILEAALRVLDERLGRSSPWRNVRETGNMGGMQEMPALLATSGKPGGRARNTREALPMLNSSAAISAPPRSLEFCPGCPHRMTYYALNRAIEQLGYTQDEVITTGDVGCTIIGMNAPLDSCWTEVAMGASIGIAQGLKHAGIERPVLAAMGDGTFYHNGIAGLLNAVQSGVNLTLIILDNSRAAMTGMQPDPGSGKRSDGTPSVRADIAMIARGCGVEYIKRLDPYDLPRMIDTLQDAMQHPGVSVVIAEAPCTTQGVLIHEPVQVNQDACLAGRGCDDTPCYHKVGCPSVLLSLDDIRPRVSIDTATCVACGLCVAACPYDAIQPIETEAESSSLQSPLFAGVSLRDMLQD
jgi:indolepyruvate ferredoxin oxidoreductase alpha subunit